jgi:hypothetical protein
LDATFKNPPADMEERLDTTRIFHSWPVNRDDLRQVRDGNHLSYGYPALSAPLGPEDELVCPPGHLDFLSERLGSEKTVHLLVVGYSAYDKSALDVIRESGAPIGSIFVVNRDRAAAVDVAGRLSRAFGMVDINDRRIGWAETGFGTWVQQHVGEYHSWLAERSS